MSTVLFFPTFEDVRSAAARAHYPKISLASNSYARPEFAMTDESGTYEKSIETGRCVMVGRNVPMVQYLSDYTYPLSGWQKVAYAYCMWHPTQALHIENSRKQYRVSSRGDHIEISLPYADYGGERVYVSCDGKTRVLVEVD